MSCWRPPDLLRCILPSGLLPPLPQFRRDLSDLEAPWGLSLPSRLFRPLLLQGLSGLEDPWDPSRPFRPLLPQDLSDLEDPWDPSRLFRPLLPQDLPDLEDLWGLSRPSRPSRPLLPQGLSDLEDPWDPWDPSPR